MIQVMEVVVKDAQEDYEKRMSDSAEKRANDSKSIEDKEVAKAGLEADSQSMGEEKKSMTAVAMATMKTIDDRHLDRHLEEKKSMTAVAIGSCVTAGGLAIGGVSVL